METAILIEGLSKKFYRSHLDRPQTFQELVARGFVRSRKQSEFWALDDVNFKLEPGRMAGIIGRNGSGKSTLLRLIGGVGQADRGRIVTQGRVGALIDLGAGFHPDLTGRENVFINGVISGLTRQEVTKNFDSIVAFAELEDFIESPLRTYSMGMQMRLAFAVAIHIQPSILLIDEVLAVGDIAFQNKCLERISQFKAQGCAILFVSHDTSLVSKVCDEALWLDKGKVLARGDAQEVVRQYLAEMETETRRRTPAFNFVQPTSTGIDLKLNENRFGSLEMKIDRVGLYNSQGEVICHLESGDGLTIIIDYVAPESIPAPIFGVTIVRGDGLVCWDGNTKDHHTPNVNVHGKGRVILTLDRLDLVQGDYYVDVGIYQQDWAYAYDYHWHAYSLEIGAGAVQKGILLPPHSWKFEGA
jgi:lipopolysaccharide transport system ATP-binding protein